MDVATLDDVVDLDSAWCDIDDPRTGEYAFALLIAGPNHEATRRHAENEGRSLAHQGKRLGSMQKAMDARSEMILTDTQTAIAKQVKTLVARTLDWKDVTKEGNRIAFDKAQVESWYQQHAWLRDALFAFIGEPRNFLKGSSTISSSTPSINSN